MNGRVNIDSLNTYRNKPTIVDMGFARTVNILKMREEFQYATMSEEDMVDFDNVTYRLISIDEQQEALRQKIDKTINLEEKLAYVQQRLQHANEMNEILERIKENFGYRFLKPKESTILLPLIHANYDIGHMNLSNDVKSALPEYCAKLEMMASSIGADVKKIFLEFKEANDTSEVSLEDRLTINLMLTQLTLESEKTGVDFNWLMQVSMDELAKIVNGNKYHYDDEDDPRL